MVGSILSGIGSLASAGTNLGFGIDTLNYNKQLQREIFQREDNAVQRRAADIKAAGGNPALAWENASGAAGAGSTIPVESPRLEDTSASFYNIDAMYNQDASVKAQIAEIASNIDKNNADIHYTNANADKTIAETATAYLNQLFIKEQMAKTRAEKDKIRSEISTIKHDLKLSVRGMLRSNDPKMSVYNTLTDAAHKVDYAFKNFNVDDISDAHLYNFLLEAGLFAIPSFAAFKIYKGVKNAAKLRVIANYVKTYGVPKSKENVRFMWRHIKRGFDNLHYKK